MCAFHLRRFRPRRGTVNVHFIVDNLSAITEADCLRMFSPWSDAFHFHFHDRGALRDPLDERQLSELGVETGHIIVSSCTDQQLQDEIQALSRQLDLPCVVPSYPPLGDLENDLLREVAHFDFELGGKNEWDGAPTQYAAASLQGLSSTHCRASYPEWAFEFLPDRPLKVLDVGCGPISVLRWGALHGKISITGVDPLLEMYAVVLARHGLDALPKVRCDREINGFAEDLDILLPDDDFDMIYTQNALDHTQDPTKVIENIARKLGPDGIAVVQVATREGTRRDWDQLHKTDIYLEDGVLKFAHQHTRAQPLLGRSGLRLKHVRTNTPDWLACALEKQ